MESIFLGLGGNVGDRRGFMRRAVEALSEDRIRVLSRSSLYASEPEGSDDQEPYLNAAVEAQTPLAPLELLRHVKDIERRLGRVVRGRWAEREIDLDILLYGARTVEEKDLTIPHPRLHERRFALMPLAEIAPEIRHPVIQKTIAELLRDCTDEKRVVRLDVEW
ncbi:MAG: 2-amino-4-hydroxy-6-hydroxymethyldihydropteridine diphosphokinase [Acidobacteriota bacterium]|nr:MAG: 2-amino-4-hydroxy-6-hydroxymethyldihydropteridine diphosphokinase [Acidobacteriota bacterium]